MVLTVEEMSACMLETPKWLLPHVIMEFTNLLLISPN